MGFKKRPFDLRIPNLDTSGIDALTVCGNVHTDSVSLLGPLSEVLEKKGAMFSSPVGDKDFQVIAISCSDTHLHLDIMSWEWVRRSGSAKPKHDFKVLSGMIRNLEGVEISYYSRGRQFLNLTEIDENSLVQTFLFKASFGDMEVEQVMGSVNLSNAPATKLEWSKESKSEGGQEGQDDATISIIVDTAMHKTRIDDLYLTHAAERFASVTGMFIGK